MEKTPFSGGNPSHQSNMSSLEMPFDFPKHYRVRDPTPIPTEDAAYQKFPKF
jgi:hypothetical protein